MSTDTEVPLVPPEHEWTPPEPYDYPDPAARRARGDAEDKAAIVRWDAEARARVFPREQPGASEWYEDAPEPAGREPGAHRAPKRGLFRRAKADRNEREHPGQESWDGDLPEHDARCELDECEGECLDRPPYGIWPRPGLDGPGPERPAGQSKSGTIPPPAEGQPGPGPRGCDSIPRLPDPAPGNVPAPAVPPLALPPGERQAEAGAGAQPDEDEAAAQFGCPADEEFWPDEHPGIAPPPETTQTMTAVLPLPGQEQR